MRMAKNSSASQNKGINLYRLIALFIAELVILMPAIATALTIDSVSVRVQSGEATILVNTDMAANITFSYGKYTGNGLDEQYLYDTENRQNHTFTIDSLEQGMRYAYTAIARSSGQMSDSRAGSFIVPDATIPGQPSGLHATNVTEDSVRLEWSTLQINDFSQYLVYRNGANVFNNTQPKFQDRNLTGLTTYNYQVAAMDKTGNIGPMSDSLMIATAMPDITPPAISLVAAIPVSNTSFMIYWQTDEPATSFVYYGIGNARGGGKQTLYGNHVNHTVTLNSLKTGNVYSFFASSCDLKGNCANSTESTFSTSNDFSAPEVSCAVPGLFNTNHLVAPCSTKPFARVLVYVNDLNDKSLPSRVVQADMHGNFTLDVMLDLSRQENTIRVESVDAYNNRNSKDYSTVVDMDKPVVNLSELPGMITQASLRLNGTVSEDVALDIYTSNEMDAKPKPVPSEPQNLKSLTSNSTYVSLDWDAPLNNSAYIEMYFIYRDGVLIGSSKQTSFRDCVLSGKSYTYEVSALNKDCVEGSPSDTLSLSIPKVTVGENCSAAARQEASKGASAGCTRQGEKPDRTVQIKQGKFQQTLSLKEGRNTIRLVFRDRVNNSIELNGNVIYDVKEPSIISNNLNMLTPAYESDITVTGRVDESATVIVTVNNGTTFTGRTEGVNNTFSIDIELEKLDYDEMLRSRLSSNQITGWATSDMSATDLALLEKQQMDNYFSYQSGNSLYNTTGLSVATDNGKWKNRIDIAAIDDVGRKGRTVSGTILYGVCSLGSYWAVTLSEFQPLMLIPRHLLNGIALVNFNYQLEWVGGTDLSPTVPRPNVNIRFRELSQLEKNDWDVEWFNSPRIVMCEPKTNCTKGYIVIEARATDNFFGNDARYRRDLADAIRKNQTDEFNTNYDKEDNVSDHRLGNCTIAGFGCVKIPLQVEISMQDPLYQINSKEQVVGPNYYRRSGYFVQRQCWDLEVPIDRRVDPGIIPKSFLRTSVSFLNKTIDAVDTVLKPLTTIKEYVLYACLASWVLLYVKAIDRRWNCEFSGTIKALSGRGFNPKVAEVGLCHAIYNPESNKEQYEACNTCTAKIKGYNDFMEKVQFICDRLACPSAPSFMKYVRQQNTKPATRASITISNMSMGSGSSSDKYAFTIQRYSDCKNVDLSFQAIALQYSTWIKYKKNSNDPALKIDNPKSLTISSVPAKGKPTAGSGSVASVYSYQASDHPLDKITCKDPHLPNSDCCVFEYMSKYDSACGLPKGMLFDEMKESYCVAGSRSYSKDSSGGNIAGVDFNSECMGTVHKTWNALAGICEKNPGEEAAIINSNLVYRVDANDPYATAGANGERVATLQDKRSEEGVIKGTDIQPAVQGSSPGSDKLNLNDPSGNNCPVSLRPNDDRSIYFRVVPLGERETTAASSGQEGLNTRYSITRGAALNNVDLEAAAKSLKPTATESSPLGSSKVYEPFEELNEDWFLDKPGQVSNDPARQKVNGITNAEGYREFKRELSKCAGAVNDKTDQITNDMIFYLRRYQGKSEEEVHKGYSSDNRLSNEVDYNTFAKFINDNRADIFNDNGQVKQIKSDTVTVGHFRNSLKDTYQQTKEVSDAIATKVYNQIRNAMILDDKPTIVDPSSSLLRSVQCICLPAITGYLKLYRSIMVAVKSCFQAILLTGDGTPGVCQAVLTQYVCDLIYDLIKCFTQKYGEGFSADYGTDSFPGNALGTLTSAGRDVEKSVVSRYGNTYFFRGLFAERQVMHAICLWFFTGSFKLDFKSMAEGEYGDVPVDSQGLIYPCQRRYIGYNSANKGVVTWNYYFGLGIVAGAEINYNVKLVCSSGYGCDYGYGKEQCDCTKSGTKVTAVTTTRGQANSGHLNKYDVLEDTFDGIITDQVRYDKVVLNYTYINKDNKMEQKSVSCDITPKGGKPPAYCQFDVGLGIYRCSVDIGAEDYALLGNVPNQEMYIDDIININVPVMQKLPTNLDCNSMQTCPSVKYLALELKKDNAIILDANDTQDYRPILIDGTFPYSMPPKDGGIKMTSDLLLSGIAQGTTGQSDMNCVPENTDGIVASCSGQFRNLGDRITLKIEGTTVTSPDGEIKYGNEQCTLSDKTNRECTFKGKNNGLTYTITFKRIGNSQQHSTYTERNTEILKPKGAASTNHGSQNVDMSKCNGAEEVKLTGTVYIFDSEQNGALYVKSNKVHEHDGKQQQQTFTLTVKCQSTGKSNNNGGQQAGGSSSASGQASSSSGVSDAQANWVTVIGSYYFYPDTWTLEVTSKQELSSLRYSITNTASPAPITGTFNGPPQVDSLNSLYVYTADLSTESRLVAGQNSVVMEGSTVSNLPIKMEKIYTLSERYDIQGVVSASASNTPAPTASTPSSTAANVPSPPATQSNQQNPPAAQQSGLQLLSQTSLKLQGETSKFSEITGKILFSSNQNEIDIKDSVGIQLPARFSVNVKILINEAGYGTYIKNPQGGSLKVYSAQGQTNKVDAWLAKDEQNSFDNDKKVNYYVFKADNVDLSGLTAGNEYYMQFVFPVISATGATGQDFSSKQYALKIV